MTDDSRPARPWQQDLLAIQRQMAGTSEAEVLAALRADDGDETVGTMTITWSGSAQNRPETISTTAAFQRTVQVRSVEQLVRSGSASTPTS